MMTLSDHPILMQAYELSQAIEACGASVELTHAVTLAGQLREAIERLLEDSKQIRCDERMKCITEIEAFAKEYAGKGVDEADQKAQAWAILQAAEHLRMGLTPQKCSCGPSDKYSAC